MLMSFLFLCSIAFAETKTLAVQICLDRAGFSCNTIDGTWGAKSQRALERYCAARQLSVPATPDEAFDRLFADQDRLFRIETVTQEDLDGLTAIPTDPADKAKLPRMNYESVLEMFAERGHTSIRAMERMNPGVDWRRLPPETRLVIPDFPPIDDELAAGERRRANIPRRPQAELVRISLARCEVCVYAADGSCLASFPCSIAKDKSKLPPHGELKITSYVARPNYTYTPDVVPKGRKVSRQVLPEGPNSPVGVVWMGLNLPGYGIHGTPRPESIGNAESHGCFRLANWNAARLFAMCRPGTRVLVEP